MLRSTTIFAKQPVAGQVKTRLSPPLSSAAAARLALAMLDDEVRTLARGDWRLGLAVAPADACAWFTQRYPQAHVEAQVGSGLGARLAEFFTRHAATEASTVVVGSDCPLLSVEALAELHARLAAAAECVLIPDHGGGYCAVGLTRPAPELFTQVEMSTPTMFDETLRVAQRSGLRVEVLEASYDVDDDVGLERLRQALRTEAAAQRAPATHALLRELEAELQR